MDSIFAALTSAESAAAGAEAAPQAPAANGSADAGVAEAAAAAPGTSEPPAGASEAPAVTPAGPAGAVEAGMGRKAKKGKGSKGLAAADDDLDALLAEIDGPMAAAATAASSKKKKKKVRSLKVCFSLLCQCCRRMVLREAVPRAYLREELTAARSAVPATVWMWVPQGAAAMGAAAPTGAADVAPDEAAAAPAEAEAASAAEPALAAQDEDGELGADGKVRVSLASLNSMHKLPVHEFDPKACMLSLQGTGS